MILRIFPAEGQHIPAYSSASDKRFHIPRSSLKEIGKGPQPSSSPNPIGPTDTPGAHSLIAVARGETARSRRCSSPPPSCSPFRGWLASPVLFWGFFIFGTLLSAGIGYVLARRLISPLRQLNEGARDIAAGKLDCQLPVRGTTRSPS